MHSIPSSDGPLNQVHREMYAGMYLGVFCITPEKVYSTLQGCIALRTGWDSIALNLLMLWAKYAHRSLHSARLTWYD
jgi:hypothetical protein